jgi:hypothetical protein
VSSVTTATDALGRSPSPSPFSPVISSVPLHAPREYSPVTTLRLGPKLTSPPWRAASPNYTASSDSPDDAMYLEYTLASPKYTPVSSFWRARSPDYTFDTVFSQFYTPVSPEYTLVSSFWWAESPDYTPSTPKTDEVFSLYYTPSSPEYTPMSSLIWRVESPDYTPSDTKDR